MDEINVLRSQEYSTNLVLLSQQMGSKFADACIPTVISGAKAKRLTSQLDKTEVQERTERAKPAMNVLMDHSGRWVYFRQFDWGKVVDDIDLLQTNIAPQGAYVHSGVAAMKRKIDSLFLQAFFGTAKAGEQGEKNINFPASHQVAETVGSTTGMNLDKMEEALEILLKGEIDIETEVPIMAISPKQHRELKALTEVKSVDYNTRRVLGEDGMLRHFNGFDLIISNRLPVDSKSKRRIPVWVKSGMGKGVWKDISGVIRKRSDLQGEPDYVETTMALDFVRLEEARCVEIKCAE